MGYEDQPVDDVSHYRDVQRMLERQGLTFLKGPFGENLENNDIQAHNAPRWRNGMDFYTERAILST